MFRKNKDNAPQPEASAPGEDWRERTKSLACSVDHLCNLCDDLLDSVKRRELTADSAELLARIPEQIDVIRQSAAYIAAEADPKLSAYALLKSDPYSLEALRRLVAEPEQA